MATLDTDIFNRTVSSGWGTASDGATWALILGHSSVLSVTGNQGLAAYDSGARDLLILGSGTTADGDFVGRFTPQSSSDYVGFVMRYTNSQNYTRVAWNQGHYLTVVSVVSNSSTSYTINNSLPYTDGQRYWLRARFIGQTFWAKVWQDGTGEPDVWSGPAITNTTSPTTAGGYGVYLLSGVSGNSVTADSLTFSDSSIFAGEADGVSSPSASLTVSHLLAGEADGASSPQATLTVTHLLAGEADGVASPSASLTVAHLLAGEADGIGGGRATLTVLPASYLPTLALQASGGALTLQASGGLLTLVGKYT